MRKTNTETLAAALDVLAREIQSGDGVANAATAEAVERLRELAAEIARELKSAEKNLAEAQSDIAEEIKQGEIYLRKIAEIKECLDRLPHYIRSNMAKLNKSNENSRLKWHNEPS